MAGSGRPAARIAPVNPSLVEKPWKTSSRGPTGDFLKRMGMPATGPQPAEVTKCFEGKPGKYGQDLISTAGYMIQGIDQVNISSCAGVKPASGYDGQTHSCR